MKGLIPWMRGEGRVPISRRETPTWAIERRMDDLLDNFFEDFGGMFGPTQFPMMGLEEKWSAESPNFEVSETEDEFCVKAELPGMDEKDIDISLEGDMLTIRGEKKHEHEEKRRDYHVSEMSYGEFCRTFTLPEGIERDRANALFSKGVLTLTLPKAEQAKVARKHIDVKAA